LLEQQHEREEAERRAKRKQDLIQRLDLKFAARDKLGVELQATLETAERQFRQLLSIVGEIGAAWPFHESQLAPAMLTPSSSALAVAHDLHRVGARPFIRAGLPQEQSFPGGKSPSINLIGQPEAVMPIAEALKRASDFARKVMRGEQL